MSPRHSLLGAALAGGTILSGVVPAAAVCDGCVVSAIHNMNANLSAHQDQTTAAVNQTTSAVVTAQNAIVAAITQGTAQVSGYQAQTPEATRRIEEAAQINDTTRARQEARARAEGGRYDPAASACTDLTGIFSFGGGQSVQGLGGNDVVNISRNRSRGNGSEGAAVRSGGLAVASEIVNARDTYEGYGGYLDPTSDLRFLTENQTLDTSKEDNVKILARLIDNIVDPTPARPISEAEAKTPQGRAQLAARTVDDARRSAASAVFAHLGELTAPTGGAELANWAKGAVTEAYPNTVGDKVSYQQAIDIFVQSRFANPDWHQQLAKMSPAAVAREMALTMALNLHVNWMRFQLEERMAAVQAANLAVNLDQSDGTSTAIPTNIPAAGGGS